MPRRESAFLARLKGRAAEYCALGKKAAEAQRMADEHRGEKWDCTLCGKATPAEKYPKHYAICFARSQLTGPRTPRPLQDGDDLVD